MTEVTEDPDLGSNEKELNITVNKADDEFFVFTEIASVARHLLTRDDFNKQDERRVDGKIVAVKGTLPMGVLKIQQNERKYGSFSEIVATHDGESE
jgi:hypothetical protein